MAEPESTTRTDSVLADGVSVKSKAVTVLLTLLLAGTILYLALPRTVAAYLALPGDPIMERLQLGEDVGAEELHVLIASRMAALGWLEAGRYYTDLGLAQLLMAFKQPEHTGRPDPKLMSEAIASLKKGLVRAPVRPQAWTQLAYAEYATTGPSKKMAAALEMALRMGPHEHDLVLPRLQLCLIAWPHLSKKTRGEVQDQIRLAWRRSKTELVEVTRLTAGADTIVREVLASDPEILAEFEKRLAERAAE